MTAGSGISHSERFDGMRQGGGRFDGIQAWVALPEANEEDDPAFDHYPDDALPIFTDIGVTSRLIAGSASGMQSPAKHTSPIFLLACHLRQADTLHLQHGYHKPIDYVAQNRLQLAWVGDHYG